MQTRSGDAGLSGRESDVNRNSGRAPRYDVHFSIRYRSVGAAHWREGEIENISRSGVLFWTEHLLAVNTPLEMSFVLPLGDRKPGIVCRGHVARTVMPKAREGPPGLAATISNYHFVREMVATA
jgi:PilZ domain-containing protein